jgi:ribosomal protein S12 methylthiotransferase accessory factor
LVPAQLAYIFYEYAANEPKIRFTTSNGAGAGDTFERAAYKAISEHIERDALLAFWLNKITPPEIDQASIKHPEIKAILMHHEEKNIAVKILDITTDTIPAYMVLTESRTEAGPRGTVTTSADLDPEYAILHALHENMMQMQAVRPALTEKNYEEVRALYPMFSTILQRVIWWTTPESRKEISWLFGGPMKNIPETRYPVRNYDELLLKLKIILKSRALDVYLVDITSELARKHHLHVVMSLIPDFIPLYLNEYRKGLAPERIYSLPVKLGWLLEPKKEEELNLVPHPLS